MRKSSFSQLWSGEFDDYIHVYNRSQIVGATVYTSISHFPRDFVFDVCIVDEAGQITEPSILQVLLLGKKSVLVGDPKQLPPLVQSTFASDSGLNVSLIARLSDLYHSQSVMREEHQYVTNLSIQYRMNESIMALANHLIYNDMLKAASKEVADAHLIVHCTENDPEWIQRTLDPGHAVVFINTDYCLSTMNKESLKSDASWSRHNLFEVSIIRHIVDALVEGGIEMNDIGVISPYAAQVLLISSSLEYLK